MDIIKEIDNRQKEIQRLADERAKAQAFIVEAEGRITYLRGQVDILRAFGEVAQDNAGQSADAQQAQAG